MLLLRSNAISPGISYYKISCAVARACILYNLNDAHRTLRCFLTLLKFVCRLSGKIFFHRLFFDLIKNLVFIRCKRVDNA